MYEPFDSDFSPDLVWEEAPSALPAGLAEMEPGVDLGGAGRAGSAGLDLT